jgi:hypothetical protein
MCLLSRQEDVPLPVLVTAYKDKSFEFVRRICRRCCAAVAFPDQSGSVRGALQQVVKNPPATYFIKKAAGALLLMLFPAARVSERACGAGILSGSQKPGHTPKSSISLKHVYEIAKARLCVCVLLPRALTLSARRSSSLIREASSSPSNPSARPSSARPSRWASRW